MSSGLIMALICAFVGIAYGVISIYSILAKPQGNEEMQRIANAIQEGAVAYLARQYRAISVVGVVLFIIGAVGMIWAVTQVLTNKGTVGDVAKIGLASAAGIAFGTYALTQATGII